MGIKGGDWELSDDISRPRKFGGKNNEDNNKREAGKGGVPDLYRKAKVAENGGMLVAAQENGEEEVFVDFDLEESLKILGNLKDKDGVEVHKRDGRLEAVKRLLAAGVNVEDLGVLVDRREDGIYNRENSLRDVDKELIMEILEKLNKPEVLDEKTRIILGEKVAEKFKKKEEFEDNTELVVVVKKDNIRYRQNSVADPTSSLIIFGNLNRENKVATGEGVFSLEVRKFALKRLVETGFDVRVLGVNVTDETDCYKCIVNDSQIKTDILVKIITEIEKREKYYDLKNEDSVLVDFLGKNRDAFVAARNIVFRDERDTQKVESSVEKNNNREKYLEYFGGEFLSDLEVIYPKKGSEFSKNKREESNKRYFDKYKFKKVTRRVELGPYKGNEAKDYKLRDMMIDYFKLESGLPRSWDPELLKKMVGGDEKRLEEIKEDLEEVRTRQQLRKLVGQDKGSGQKVDGGGGRIDRDNFDFNGKTLEQLLDMAPDSTDPKFYIAARVILGEADPRFATSEEAKEYFFDQIEGKKEFELTIGVRNLLKDWVDIRDGSRRPDLPSNSENLARLADLGFEPTQAVLENVRQALDSVRFSIGDIEGAKKYLSSLFVGSAGGGGGSEKPEEPKDKNKEGEEINEEEKWSKMADLLVKLEDASGDERKALYLEIESHGVRIRGTVSDLIEAGAGEEEIKKSFRHMANMVKVWKMGETKAKREYPKMVEKYASMARLLRLKWYN